MGVNSTLHRRVVSQCNRAIKFRLVCSSDSRCTGINIDVTTQNEAASYPFIYGVVVANNARVIAVNNIFIAENIGIAYFNWIGRVTYSIVGTNGIVTRTE